MLISTLTASILSGLENNTDLPPSVIESAPVQLAAGVPFISDADLEEALEEAQVPQATADVIMEENTAARVVALQVSFGLLALFAVVALFFTGRLPRRKRYRRPWRLQQTASRRLIGDGKTQRRPKAMPVDGAPDR